MTNLELGLIIAVGIAILIALIILLTVGIKKGWISKLYKFLEGAIKEAEAELPEGNGSKKKDIVMEVIAISCKNLHIPYFLVKKPISKLIDKIIEHYNILAKK